MKEIDWSPIVDAALIIWRDRAEGKKNCKSCPLCSVTGGSCGNCILVDCFATPFGRWDHFYKSPGKRMEAAKDMVLMFEAYQKGNMELFEKYLNYWADVDCVCVFEEE